MAVTNLYTLSQLFKAPEDTENELSPRNRSVIGVF